MSHAGELWVLVWDWLFHQRTQSNLISDCMRKALEKWLQLDGNDATWRKLITNIQKAKLELGPIEEISICGISDGV